jgi:hypothetical protein
MKADLEKNSFFLHTNGDIKPSSWRVQARIHISTAGVAHPLSLIAHAHALPFAAQPAHEVPPPFLKFRKSNTYQYNIIYI